MGFHAPALRIQGLKGPGPTQAFHDYTREKEIILKRDCYYIFVDIGKTYYTIEKLMHIDLSLFNSNLKYKSIDLNLYNIYSIHMTGFRV